MHEYNRVRAPHYKEAHARQDLIDPLFIALGWDAHNESHAAPGKRQVIVESTLEVEGSTRAPDYEFRYGSDTMFYAEAKKPGVAVNTAAGAEFNCAAMAGAKSCPSRSSPISKSWPSTTAAADARRAPRALKPILLLR